MAERQHPIDNITYVLDRFYGKVEFGQDDLKLFQTREIARLRQVSHSAIPTWTIPVGMCASKFEHSIGVLHLARITSEKPEFQGIAKDLQIAALAHDIGTPPFSHASEYFQITIFGKNHEEFVEEIIEGSEFAREVKKQGGNLNMIMELINGKGKYGELMNGSIDLDNLDTSLRYGVSIGLINNPPYSPEKLASAFVMIDGQLAILPGHQNELRGWEETRKIVYDFVYGHRNLAPAMMLSRALDFARKEGKLTMDYFRMTDAQAFDYLMNQCNDKTQTIMERVNRWQYYPRIFNFSTTSPSNEMEKLFLDSENRWLMSDEIAKTLKIPLEDVSVYMGKDKGFKKIHLPILDNENNSREHQPTNKLKFMAQVYIHTKWEGKVQLIHELMSNKLGL